MTNGNYSRRKYMEIGAALTAGGLAGCVGNKGSNGGSGSKANKINIWSQSWGSKAPKVQDYIKEHVQMPIVFTKMRYPDIKKKVLVGADTGTPDVIESIPSHRGDFVSADVVTPLTDRINQLDYKEGYIGLDTLTYKDEIWALPVVGNGRGTVYRQDIFKEYGEFPDDWSKFIKMASDITKSEDNMYGFSLTSKKGNGRVPQEYFSMLYQLTDNIYKPKGDGWELAVSAKDLGRVFEAYYWAPFYATDPPATNPDARGIGSLEHDLAYLNGNYASLQTGPWLPGLSESKMQKQAMSNYRHSGVAHNPRVKGGEKATFKEITPVFVNKYSEHKDAAWNAVKAGTSPEGINKYLSDKPGTLPAHEAVEWKIPEKTNNPDWAKFQEIFKTGELYGFWSLNKISDTLHDLTQAVMYDKIDPMEAGKRMHKQWSQAKV